MFEISIYGKYNIKHSWNATTKDYEQDFVTESNTETFWVNGSELMALLSNKLKSNDLGEIFFNSDGIALSYFNPTTGECSDDSYVILEKKSVFDEEK